jgi:hypothetical protein
LLSEAEVVVFPTERCMKCMMQSRQTESRQFLMVRGVQTASTTVSGGLMAAGRPL